MHEIIAGKEGLRLLGQRLQIPRDPGHHFPVERLVRSNIGQAIRLTYLSSVARWFGVMIIPIITWLHTIAYR